MTQRRNFDQKGEEICLRHYSSENKFEPVQRPKLKIQLPTRLRSPSQLNNTSPRFATKTNPLLKPTRRSYFKNFALKIEAAF